jgi:hypothetical protein
MLEHLPLVIVNGIIQQLPTGDIISSYRPNLLTNPNWLIDQINEGALYTVNTTGVKGPDGIVGNRTGGGTFKLRTIVDPDNICLRCLEISCTTVDSSIASTDKYEIATSIEGYDAAALQFGLSSGLPITFQFGLKSNSVTGIFGIYFTNGAGNRFYAGTINVVDTNYHEYAITLIPDTTGTWLYTNGIGLRIGFVLAAGSNFQGTANVWTSSSIITTSSQANFMSTNTNIIYLKRMQLFVGSIVQPYQPADVQKELAKAQRQYFKTYNQGVVPGTVTAVGALCIQTTGTTNGLISVVFPVHMRAVPTTAYYSPITGAAANWRRTAIGADVAVSSFGNTGQATTIVNVADSVYGHLVADARFIW